MKTITNFIFEKLKLSKDIALEEWNINNAADGDIIQWNDSELYFIYKCLNTNQKYSHANEDSIVFHIAVNLERDIVYPGPDTGIGDISKPELYKLVLSEEKI